MVRILGISIIIFVAGITVCWSPGIPVLMTFDAGKRLVCACQGKGGIIMIKGGRRPGDIRMTKRAVLVKIVGNVVGILNTIIIIIMTGIAVCWCG
jgi:hypothetical protein